MERYHIDLAGLHTVLQTPENIHISARLQPFLEQAQPTSDCVITVEERRALPLHSDTGSWYGLEYYDLQGGTSRIFHHHNWQQTAFAVTEMHTDGNITVGVLPEFLNYFVGSSGIFNRIGMENLLLQHHGLLLHASLIDYSGKGIAFTGPSGVGKSTQADIWKSYLGATVLNGDRAALRKKDDRWMAYGSPYAGTSGIYKKASVPLAAVVALRQAEKNRLRVLPAAEALQYIYPELSVHRWDKLFVDRVLDLALQLLADVPVYLLECVPEESAALLLKRGLAL